MHYGVPDVSEHNPLLADAEARQLGKHSGVTQLSVEVPEDISLNLAWSDAAREAALKARRAGAGNKNHEEASRSALEATDTAENANGKNRGFAHYRASQLHEEAAQKHDKLGSKDIAAKHRESSENHRKAAEETREARPKMAKLTITKAAKMLVDRGYELQWKGAKYDLKTGITSYQVKTPDGETKTMTADEIKGLISSKRKG
jgi:hypothetical protein